MLSKSWAVANGDRNGPHNQAGRAVGLVISLCNFFDLLYFLNFQLAQKTFHEEFEMSTYQSPTAEIQKDE